MSTLNDVQNALVDVITPIVYPNGIGQPSIVGNYVSAIAVTNSGTDYTTASVIISGGGGIGAQAEAIIFNEQIASITIIEKGYGYTSAPTITITGDGTGATATATILPTTVSVFAGDPLKLDLDTILRRGENIIAVFAIRGMTRNTTRIRREYTDQVVQAATIFLTVNGNTITLSGTVTPAQSCMIIVKNVGYAYAAIAGDTLDTIALSLADLIPNASAVANVITVSDCFNIVARVSVPGSARRILHSQESLIRARIISPNNETRDILGNAVQIGVGANGYYLPMPDLISASIKPNNIAENNTYELDLAYVRDYVYLVEYHTVQVSQFQTIADAYAIFPTD